jgi:hypothetical protein
MQPPLLRPNRFTRKAPIPTEVRLRLPLPSNLKRAYYPEHEVNAWIRCQLEGRPWVPVPVPDGEPLRLLSRAVVLDRISVCSVTLFRMEKRGLFPRGVRAVPPGIWERAEQAEIAAR